MIHRETPDEKMIKSGKIGKTNFKIYSQQLLVCVKTLSFSLIIYGQYG